MKSRHIIKILDFLGVKHLCEIERISNRIQSGQYKISIGELFRGFSLIKTAYLQIRNATIQLYRDIDKTINGIFNYLHRINIKKNLDLFYKRYSLAYIPFIEYAIILNPTQESAYNQWFNSLSKKVMIKIDSLEDFYYKEFIKVRAQVEHIGRSIANNETINLNSSITIDLVEPKSFPFPHSKDNFLANIKRRALLVLNNGNIRGFDQILYELMVMEAEFMVVPRNRRDFLFIKALKSTSQELDYNKKFNIN